MRLLIIGGTSFVGRHIVDAALAAGDEVTIANRGQTNPDLFGAGQVEMRRIDRSTDDLGALGEGSWDATIDVTAYVPRHVRALADALGTGSSTDPTRGGRYVFISTGSVYDPEAMAAGEASEDCGRYAPETESEEITNETYGPLKVACEDLAVERFDDVVVVRPGIVAGPYDPTDRFTFWPRLLAPGAPPLLVPRRPDQPVQVVDGRDLGAFCHLVATRPPAAGPTFYNGVGDVHPLSDFVTAVAAGVGNPQPAVEWADPGWWRDQKAPSPPLVLDAGWNLDALFARSNERAKAAGFVVRPLAETAADTRAWDLERGEPPLVGAPTPEEHATLLRAWRDRS